MNANFLYYNFIIRERNEIEHTRHRVFFGYFRRDSGENGESYFTWKFELEQPVAK